ncbi:hypothetical protein ARALYDRAFT_896770 [Arabidopsis lyrata subsp. lyrata]|uniref:Uncharacterized protein n=1 Tax=Arabidopsis lyrata subsp. lyrata TaxID=81972 RepID=D7L5H9_ARALL|nr:uncharacterized protein LOC9320650 [Arabidopsis lyrata subsp. lyrata]EFH60843.1 hypothetical protein ARALYDRAFT_896770 [Arabidopsis lyrata subsp. lyrata]|eukprot:XP_002884584.1 uncharacterized protein LOC9320650 [Arabidopsis lyrata subsp. lyrata]
MSKRSKGKKNRKKKPKIPQRVEVYGVNDPVTRTGWTILAFLCVFGAVSAVNALKIEMYVGYKYLGMVVVSLYVIHVLTSMFSEAPFPVYRAHRWVRMVVPLILFSIIYFTVFNFPTFAVSVLILSIVFGIFVLVQLVFPVDGFHFFYVVVILVFGGFSALYACYYDPKIQPFWFCFFTLYVFELFIYYFNYPGPTHRAFSFY